MARELADEDLLGEARVGNVAAFEEFYRRWMPAVMSNLPFGEWTKVFPTPAWPKPSSTG